MFLATWNEFLKISTTCAWEENNSNKESGCCVTLTSRPQNHIAKLLQKKTHVDNMYQQNQQYVEHVDNMYQQKDMLSHYTW